ncbi:hypothetical protein ACFVAJ_17320 [Agromyces sp. NPDC057679]|uniref:hypothetical protein n=1 Tax=Agromyces sp. NPDC057679 TaxID=3346207 RepID=UPI00366DB748
MPHIWVTSGGDRDLEQSFEGLIEEMSWVLGDILEDQGGNPNPFPAERGFEVVTRAEQPYEVSNELREASRPDPARGTRPVFLVLREGSEEFIVATWIEASPAQQEFIEE